MTTRQGLNTDIVVGYLIKLTSALLGDEGVAVSKPSKVRGGMSTSSLTTWHFFRRVRESDLWCAVPAHQALPPFLLSGAWHFSGHRRAEDDAPPGFDDGAAAVAEHFNGFYLFQLVGRPPAL